LLEKLALEMVMYTCPERQNTRAATLRSLGETDWRSDFRLVTDCGRGSPSLARMATTFVRALDAAASSKADFVVVVEDDVRFNRYFEHNVREWCERIAPQSIGSLYHSSLSAYVGNQAIVAAPSAWRALWTVAHLRSAEQLQPFDRWLRRTAGSRFVIHRPSLVDHVAHASTCGHPLHHAVGFDPWWRA